MKVEAFNKIALFASIRIQANRSTSGSERVPNERCPPSTPNWLGGSGVPGGQRSHSAASAIFRKVLAVGRLQLVGGNGDFRRIRSERDGECCNGLHWSDPFFTDAGIFSEITYPIYLNIMSTDISIFFIGIDDSHELVNLQQIRRLNPVINGRKRASSRQGFAALTAPTKRRQLSRSSARARPTPQCAGPVRAS